MPSALRSVTRSIAALMLGVILTTPAAAFTSVPPGESAHDLITADAAGPLGFPDHALKALQEAVRRPDADESKLTADGESIVILDAAADYSQSHHCDRIPPMTDAETISNTLAFIQGARRDALLWVRSGHEERTMRALGNALHALQDCFSHSDVVDWPASMQTDYLDAVVHGTEAPSNIRITGLQPGAEEAEFPPGDAYPHGDFAKDGKNITRDAAAVLPDGRTKYEAAAALATTATHMFLSEFLDNITAQERDLLWTAKGDGKDLPLPVALVLPVLAAVAVRMRHRTDR